jgi:hypothetical protein
MTLAERAPALPARSNARAGARKRCFDYLAEAIRTGRPVPSYQAIGGELELWPKVVCLQFQLMLAERLIARETDGEGNVRWRIDGLGESPWERRNPGSRGRGAEPPATKPCMCCGNDFATRGLDRLCPRCRRRG